MSKQATGNMGHRRQPSEECDESRQLFLDMAIAEAAGEDLYDEFPMARLHLQDCWWCRDEYSLILSLQQEKNEESPSPEILWELLQTAANSKDHTVRVPAVRIITELLSKGEHPSKVIDFLKSLVRDSHETVRRLVANVLGSILWCAKSSGSLVKELTMPIRVSPNISDMVSELVVNGPLPLPWRFGNLVLDLGPKDPPPVEFDVPIAESFLTLRIDVRKKGRRLFVRSEIADAIQIDLLDEKGEMLKSDGVSKEKQWNAELSKSRAFYCVRVHWPNKEMALRGFEWVKLYG